MASNPAVTSLNNNMQIQQNPYAYPMAYPVPVRDRNGRQHAIEFTPRTSMNFGMTLNLPNILNHTVPCPFCKREIRRELITDHLSMELAYKPYLCIPCKAKFSSRRELHLHMELICGAQVRMNRYLFSKTT